MTASGALKIGSSFLKIGSLYLRIGPAAVTITTALATFGDAAAIQQDAVDETLFVHGSESTDFYDNTSTLIGAATPDFWILAAWNADGSPWVSGGRGAWGFNTGTGTISHYGQTGTIDLYKVTVSAFSEGGFSLVSNWTAAGTEVTPYIVAVGILIPCKGSDASVLGTTASALSAADSAELAFGSYTGSYPGISTPWQGDTGAGTTDGSATPTSFSLDALWLNPASTSTEQTTDAWSGTTTHEAYLEILN